MLQQLDATKAQLARDLAQLEEAKAALDEARAQLEAEKAQLEAHKAQLEEKEAWLAQHLQRALQQAEDDTEALLLDWELRRGHKQLLPDLAAAAAAAPALSTHSLTPYSVSCHNPLFEEGEREGEGEGEADADGEVVSRAWQDGEQLANIRRSCVLRERHQQGADLLASPASAASPKASRTPGHRRSIRRSAAWPNENNHLHVLHTSSSPAAGRPVSPLMAGCAADLPTTPHSPVVSTTGVLQSRGNTPRMGSPGPGPGPSGAPGVAAPAGSGGSHAWRSARTAATRPTPLVVGNGPDQEDLGMGWDRDQGLAAPSPATVLRGQVEELQLRLKLVGEVEEANAMTQGELQRRVQVG